LKETMQTKSEILASNPDLNSYRVMLHEDKGDKFQVAFDCYAEDDDHAAEQAQDAYPNGEVLTVTPFSGNNAKTAKELSARYGHTDETSRTTLKTQANPDASDGHDEMMDLTVCGVGDAAFLEWLTEYGDPIGEPFQVADIADEDLPDAGSGEGVPRGPAGPERG
jgi:1,2-phenylacetyl-CoA epoxidase PaaB subunit